MRRDPDALRRSLDLSCGEPRSAAPADRRRSEAHRACRRGHLARIFSTRCRLARLEQLGLPAPPASNLRANGDSASPLRCRRLRERLQAGAIHCHGRKWHCRGPRSLRSAAGFLPSAERLSEERLPRRRGRSGRSYCRPADSLRACHPDLPHRQHARCPERTPG